jgi:hypothetical protein
MFDFISLQYFFHSYDLVDGIFSIFFENPSTDEKSIVTMTIYWITNSIKLGYLWNRFTPHLKGIINVR